MHSHACRPIASIPTWLKGAARQCVDVGDVRQHSNDIRLGTYCVRDVASDRVHNGSRLHGACGSAGQQGRVQEVVPRGH